MTVFPIGPHGLTVTETERLMTKWILRGHPVSFSKSPSTHLQFGSLLRWKRRGISVEIRKAKKWVLQYPMLDLPTNL